MKKKNIIIIIIIVLIIVIAGIIALSNREQYGSSFPGMSTKIEIDNNITVHDNIYIDSTTEDSNPVYIITKIEEFDKLPYKDKLVEYTYDEEFFKEHNLFVFGRVLGSSSNALICQKAEITDNNELLVNVGIDSANVGTCDMAYKVVALETPKNVTNVVEQKNK